MRSAARTIRSMTTCDPRCWRFCSRNVSAASTSATRLAGTEISRCPLFPLSDRRVTFISVSVHSLRIYSIAYTRQENDICHSYGYLHVYTICGTVCTYSGESPFSAVLVCLYRASPRRSVPPLFARSRVDVHGVPRRTRHGIVSVHPYLRLREGGAGGAVTLSPRSWTLGCLLVKGVKVPDQGTLTVSAGKTSRVLGEQRNTHSSIARIEMKG